MPDEQEKEQETCFEEENRAWRLHVPSARNSPINSVRPKGTNITFSNETRRRDEADARKHRQRL